MRTLLVIPIFNEQKNLFAVLNEVRFVYADDIILVNDGSTDDTGAMLDDVKGNTVRVITHKRRLGYGQSVIDGFTAAQNGNYDVLVTMDCDRQHDPHYIPRFLSGISECKCDVLSGSRYLESTPLDQPPPLERLAINRRITSLINEVTGYGITDAFCGYKGYRVKALKNLHLDEPGYAFPVQFWIQAFHSRLEVKEIAVPRLYPANERGFMGELNDPAIRLKYYLSVFEKERIRWLEH